MITGESIKTATNPQTGLPWNVDFEIKELPAKYKAISVSLREERVIEIEEYQATIEDIEVLLQEDYQKLLKEDEFEGFYADGDEYDTEVQVHTNNIIVTNKRTSAKKYFDYIGNLQSVNVKEHRLVLYSVVRGDDG